MSMGTQPLEETAGPQAPAHVNNGNAPKTSRRRNTVHATSVVASLAPAAATPWPPLAMHYPAPQPILVPLHSPLWQLAAATNLNQAGLVPVPLPVTLPPPAFSSTPHDRALAGSRSGSPHDRGRRRARSPEHHHDGDPARPDTSRFRSERWSRHAPLGGDPDTFSPPLPPTSVSPWIGASNVEDPSSMSHQASSVPSTPRQRSRKLSGGTAATSPHRDAPLSPRSVRSESSSQLPALRQPLLGCRFETGMSYPRRRMPYALGGDPLEKVTSGVKKQLQPDEEKKLSGDMRELYDRLLPSADSDDRRARFVQKLDRLLNKQWPGADIQIRVFGSSGNLLCTSDSDVDICIVTPKKELERVCLLAKVLSDNGMERVVCVPNAKVPIVKMWDPELRLACDMNVNNTMALENTRMVKTYVEIDPRVRPLAMVIKHWTKRRLLNDAAFGGTLSSYTWICLILNFLQTRNPPILPALHQRPHLRRRGPNGVESSFADDLSSLRGFGEKNRQTLGELLFHFFRYYGHEVNYEKDVVSVRQGRLLSKEEKGWHLKQNNRMCVEEPFNVNRNLGNTADDASFRGLHLELRRAFTLIADKIDLEACCEQYVFPAEEERVWERAPPQPRPILSRSNSQSGRGGRASGNGMRGGRGHPNHTHRGPPGGRRASSGAAFGHAAQHNYHPYTALTVAAQDAYRPTQAQLEIQDHIYRSFHALQAQKQELSLMQAQTQAAAHAAHARQDASGRRPRGAPPSHLSTSAVSVSGPYESTPHTAPLRPQMFFYPLQFTPTQPYFTTASAATTAAPTATGVNTSPSSPSLVPLQPEPRRSIHRPQVVDGSDSAGLRSHSQPARPVRSSLRLQAVQTRSPSRHDVVRALPSDYRSRGAGSREAEYPGGHLSASSASQGRLVPPSARTEEMPKEYVGYYVEGSPSSFRRLEDVLLRPVPAFGDLTPAPLTAPPDQLTFDGLEMRRNRSASWVTWDRPDTQTNGARYSPAVGVSQATENGRHELERAKEHRGPLIVDGSSSRPRVDARSHATPVSESASASDDPDYATAEAMSDSQHQDQFERPRLGSVPEGAENRPYLDYRRPAVVSSTAAVPTTAAHLRADDDGRALSPALMPSAFPTLLPSEEPTRSGSPSPPRSPYLPNGGIRLRAHVSSDTLHPLNTSAGPALGGGADAHQASAGSIPPGLLSPVLETASPLSASGKQPEYFPPPHAPSLRTNGFKTGRHHLSRAEGLNNMPYEPRHMQQQQQQQQQQPPSPSPAPASAGYERSHRRDILSAKPNGYVRDREREREREKERESMASGGAGVGAGAGNASAVASSSSGGNAANGWQQQSGPKHHRKGGKKGMKNTNGGGAGAGAGGGNGNGNNNSSGGGGFGENPTAQVKESERKGG